MNPASPNYSPIKWFDGRTTGMRPTVNQRDVPSWVAHVLTPPEVIAAYVERRINDPALLTVEQSEPTYADFLSAE